MKFIECIWVSLGGSDMQLMMSMIYCWYGTCALYPDTCVIDWIRHEEQRQLCSGAPSTQEDLSFGSDASL